MSLVKGSSKFTSLNTCGCSPDSRRLHEVNVVDRADFSSGRCSRKMETAASVSSVGPVGIVSIAARRNVVDLAYSLSGLTVVNPRFSQSCMPPRYQNSLCAG